VRSTSKYNLLDKYSIEYALRDFWKKIMVALPKDKIVYFLFRIKYTGEAASEYKTLSILQKINQKSFKELLNFYIGTLDYKHELYYTTKIDEIIFTYIIVSDKKLKSKETKIGPSLKQQPKIESLKFWGQNIPNTMNFIE